MTPEQVKALPLGAPVRYSAHLIRERKSIARRWLASETAQPVDGVFIGWRVLSDGEYWIPDPFDDDDGGGYRPTDYHVAALVAYHPRCKPELVPCAALEAANG